MLLTPPHWKVLSQALPLDDVVRIELREGVPIFRAVPHVQDRLEDLLEKQQTVELTTDEKRELLQYEELDDFLSLVNRLVRNLMQADGQDPVHVSAA